MIGKPAIPDDSVNLRRRAEARLAGQPGSKQPASGDKRLLHELEVHQIELEMQNAELQKARDELEKSLEKFTDLYDFAPVGYFSLDESGVILEANLTGASLLGRERSRLINRNLLVFMSGPCRPTFLAYLRTVFSGPRHHSCEALLLKPDGGTYWAGFSAASAVSVAGSRKWCRLAFTDISERKQNEESQR